MRLIVSLKRKANGKNADRAIPKILTFYRTKKATSPGTVQAL